MNFGTLQDVIKYLLAFVPCPSCKKKLKAKDVHVIAAVPDGGLLFVTCHSCAHANSMQFTLKLASIRQGKKEFVDVKFKNGMNVNANDVIDMHNRLQNFTGDIHELFS